MTVVLVLLSTLDAASPAFLRNAEVMRRASPVDTNALELRLNRGLPGRGRVLTVALTRVAGQQVAIVCERDRGLIENLTAS